MTTDSPSRDRARSARPLRTSAWVFVLVLAVLGFGFLASRPAPLPAHHPLDAGPAAAKHAISELLVPGAPTRALAALPSDFSAVTGVDVAVREAPDGTRRVVHAGGGCSTPWGEDATRWNFGVACKTHDLGYDLLRYAATKGQPLNPGLRRALDEQLSADMHTMCRINPRGAPRTCDAVAWIYTAGLVVNSWHQRWGPPVGQPLAPMLAGVAAIAVLLAFRLRGWLRARRGPPDESPAPAPEPAERGKTSRRRPGPWTALGVCALTVTLLGQAVVALAGWAGIGDDWLWPLTWIAQLTCVFFFAGGRANAAGWRAARGDGLGYRHYLAGRVGWLLRPAMVFAVVALAMPLALELLGISAETTAAVLRIGLRPLWLLGVYVLTVAAAPPLLALHARARLPTYTALTAIVACCALAARLGGTQLASYAATLGLALLVQQCAFQRRWPRPVLLGGAVCAGTALVLLMLLEIVPRDLLGVSKASPALAGPAPTVTLLAVSQLCVFGLVRTHLEPLGRARLVRRLCGLALRAPMSLYLGFLTVMLLVVTVVATPSAIGDWFAWLARPSSLLALCLPAVPAVAVFWWFERHLGPGPEQQVWQQHTAGRLDALLARAATALGTGYAVIGLFGLALASFGEVVGHPTLLGLSLEPIQSLLRMLLGIYVLHTVRTGASSAVGTWVLTALACVPPILAATAPGTVDVAAVVLHGTTALFALAAAGTITGVRIRAARFATLST